MAWTCDDVWEWIISLRGEAYAPYANSFKQRNINGDRLLNVVDNKALRELGIKKSVDHKVILGGIEELKKRLSAYARAKTIDDEFEGDYILTLRLTQTTYPNTTSCVLQPQENENHTKLYNQILEWLGPLPSDVNVDKIELIHNTDLYRVFLQQMKRIESRKAHQDFQSDLDAESNPTERQKVLDRLKGLTQQVHHNQSVPVVRVWHGCSRKTVPKLLSDGFAALSKLDKGWFGTAMYFTSSAKYAAEYIGSNGCLIMCYVALLNPFPVIADDAPPGTSSKNFRFYGRGNYANYQCHYVPVAPVDEMRCDYRPPPSGVEDASYDELAIFQQADILPQVVVHLKPRTTASTSATSEVNLERMFLCKE